MCLLSVDQPFVQDYVAVLEKYFPGRMEMMLFLRYSLAFRGVLEEIFCYAKHLDMGYSLYSGKFESGWEVIKILIVARISRLKH